MKITVLSNTQSKSYKTDKKSVLIRIGDTLDTFDLPPLDNPTQYHAIYQFQFFDIAPKPSIPSNWNPFSKKNAKDMLEVFHSLKKDSIEEVIIHCAAGVSRSPATAISLAWFLNQEEDIPKLLEKAVPNAHILTLMAQEMNIYEEKRDFIQKVNIFDDESIEDIIF